MYIKATYTLNIFIAYHPDDAAKLKELRSHLLDLNKKNKGYKINKVSYDGHDLSIEGRAIISEFASAADMVLLLMSENSVLSTYFLSQELRQTLKLHQAGKTIVVPIILNTCWWEDTPYKHLEVLPRAGLPIYDSQDVKNELFDQVVEELDERLDKVRHKKQELEESFKAVVQEANRIFENWEKHPETLRSALPLFKEALEHWREGFIPTKEVIEQRITICLREIDFKHYAKAAHEAYKEGDFQTTFFNCKDALNLRDDAVIRVLFEKVKKQLDDEEQRILMEPFEKHLQKAHALFLDLKWKEAQSEYDQALEFHEPEFYPTQEMIEHKISICKREYELENSIIEADNLYKIQDYHTIVNSLLETIKSVNHQAFDRIDHAIKLIGDLEVAIPFRDQRTNKWGFYNKEDKSIIIAPKYTAAYHFSENLAGVKKWEQWGFIDIEGNEIIPFIYDFVGHFNGGIADVMKNNEIFYINHRGERLPDVEARKILAQIPPKSYLQPNNDYHEYRKKEHEKK